MGADKHRLWILLAFTLNDVSTGRGKAWTAQKLHVLNRS